LTNFLTLLKQFFNLAVKLFSLLCLIHMKKRPKYQKT